MRQIYRGPSGVCGTFQINTLGNTVQLLRKGEESAIRYNGGATRGISPIVANRLMEAKGRPQEYMPIIYALLGEELLLDPFYLELARRNMYGRR